MLWQLSGLRSLGERAEEAIAAAEELAFSVVSFAEIGVKAAIGKLTVPDDLHAHVVATGVRLVALSAEHGLAVAGLPLHHRDPFDRLLVAQARLDRWTLLTADPRLRAYDAPRARRAVMTDRVLGDGRRICPAERVRRAVLLAGRPRV